ncbi:MAG: hypothetical protein AMJ75_06880 [Phycisphaerae bacterium SM1_79]|nr:MAG: hypothetical protein AMJ75_06880 [Phycisphaerae bacterium SM1_79]
MSGATVNWRIYFWWAVSLGALLLLAVTTFWLGGKGNEIVSYISFASALASIVLAVVAIVYTFVCSIQSQQNVVEMRNLISEASHLIVEKAGVLTTKAASMEESSLSIVKFLQTGGRVSSPSSDLEGQTFKLNISDCSNQGLMILYFLAQCCEHNREPTSDKLWLCLYGPVLSVNHRLIEIYADGFVDGISCFLEPGSKAKREVQVMGEVMQLPGKLTRLPKDFKKYTRDAIGKRIEEGGFDEGTKAQWREAIDRIDTYAESGEVKMSGFGT